MARKREERVIRQAYKKEKKAQAYLGDDVNFASFKNQLNAIGLELKDIPGDGNCLFRALGDQLDGNSKHHMAHRQDVVEHMVKNRDDFEPFVEDDVPFQRHVNNLKKPGTYAGNDAIVAFARLHKLNIVIHQMNSPVWQINGCENTNAKQLHISYHNGDHYSSVRRIGDSSNQPTNIRIGADGKSSDSKVQGKDPKPTKQNYGYLEDDLWQSADMTDDQMDCSYLSGATVANNCDDSGVARVTRTADDIIEMVMNETGCQDRQLISETLDEHGYDLDTSISFILHIMDTEDCDTESDRSPQPAGLWSENGTANRVFGSLDSGGAKPKTQQLNSKPIKKQQKKREKKARAFERHKQRLQQGGGAGPSGSTSVHSFDNNSDDEAHIVQNMGSLVI